MNAARSFVRHTARSARGQWRRVGRLDLFLRAVAGMVGLSTIIGLLVHGRAPQRRMTVDIGPIRGLPTLLDVETVEGLTATARTSSVVFGIVALAVTASVIGGDYDHGTIRLWLVRQADRRAHVTGLTASLTGLLVAAYTPAFLVSLPVSFGLAAWRGIDTGAWTSADAVGSAAGAWLGGAAAVVTWVVIGAAVAALTRSAALTITTMTTTVVLESIVSSAWASSERWLPETTLANLAVGGSPTQSQGAALALAVAYGAVALVAALATVARRDVNE